MEISMPQRVYRYTPLMLPTLGVVLLLVPIWAFPTFLTTDGPSHLNNAVVMRSLLLEGGESPYAAWLHVEGLLTSNILGMGLMLLLLPVFGTGATEQAVLSIIVVAGACGWWQLLRHRVQYPMVLFFAGLPAFQGWTFHMGFHNYGLAMAGALWMVHFGLRLLETDAATIETKRPWRLALAFAFWSTWTMLANPLPWLVAGLPLALWTAWRLGFGPRISWQTLALLVLPLLPAAGMLLIARASMTMGSMGMGRLVPFEVLWSFVEHGIGLGIYRMEERHWALYGNIALVLLAFGGVALRIQNRHSNRGDRMFSDTTVLWCIGLAWTAVFWILPSNMKATGVLPYRLFPFFWWALILISAPLANTTRVWLRRSLTLLGFAFGLTFMILRWPHYAANARLVDAVQACRPHLQSGDYVLPLYLDRNGWNPDGSVMHPVWWGFTHISGWLHADDPSERPMVLVDNYEAYLPWFPISWNQGRNSYARMGFGWEEAPPRLPLDHPLLNEVDAVLLLFDFPGGMPDSTRTWLETQYRLATIHPPAALYRRR